MSPKIKVQTFFLKAMFSLSIFGQVTGNMGKFGDYLGKFGAQSALI